jgi:hypothetical protein
VLKGLLVYDLAGALPGEGPLRIDLYQACGADTPLKVKLLRALWGLFQLAFLPAYTEGAEPSADRAAEALWREDWPGIARWRRGKIWVPWNLTMGERSAAIGFNTEIYNFAPVVIGRHVVISQHNYICTSTHDYTHPNFPLVSKPIRLVAGVGGFRMPAVAGGDDRRGGGDRGAVAGDEVDAAVDGVRG